MTAYQFPREEVYAALDSERDRPGGDVHRVLTNRTTAPVLSSGFRQANIGEG